MQSLCAQRCVFMCRIVCLGDCLAGECVFHYSHINSEFSREEEAHKYKQNREKRERNIHVLPLSLCVIRGLQALHSSCARLKNPFLISHGYSASFTAGLWSHLCPFSLICHYKESCFFFFSCHGSSHTKTHLACEKGKRGRPADLFVINWHAATIDYWTWQCLFQRNLSAVTSLALLQQGQRTQRETNQYHIECKSGRSLIWGDERRETKKEDLGTEKGEREKVKLWRQRREKNWLQKDRIE